MDFNLQERCCLSRLRNQLQLKRKLVVKDSFIKIQRESYQQRSRKVRLLLLTKCLICQEVRKREHQMIVMTGKLKKERTWQKFRYLTLLLKKERGILRQLQICLLQYRYITQSLSSPLQDGLISKTPPHWRCSIQWQAKRQQPNPIQAISKKQAQTIRLIPLIHPQARGTQSC